MRGQLTIPLPASEHEEAVRELAARVARWEQCVSSRQPAGVGNARRAGRQMRRDYFFREGESWRGI